MATKTKIEFIARGLCTSGSKVLLCRNVKHGYHYLPGGHVEFGEPADAALAREFMEETGIEAGVGSLMLVTEHTFMGRKGKPNHELNMVFHVEHLELPDPDEDDQPSGSECSAGDSSTPPPPIPSLEPKIAFDWIELAAIPETEVRPPEIKAWLAAGGELDEESEAVGWVSNCDPQTMPIPDAQDE